MHSINKIIYFLLFDLIVSISLGAFLVFKPFSYVDNSTSKIVCAKNNSPFDIGPNFIYTLDQTLDDFNDIKARKLCENGIIRDYGNTVQTPATINYTFSPVYTTNSSWGDALLLASGILFLVTLLIHSSILKLTLPYLLLIVTLSTILFLFFIKTPSQALHCKRQIAQKVVNFRNSAFKNGVIAIPEEDQHIAKITKTLFTKCMREWKF